MERMKKTGLTILLVALLVLSVSIAVVAARSKKQIDVVINNNTGGKICVSKYDGSNCSVDQNYKIRLPYRYRSGWSYYFVSYGGATYKQGYNGGKYYHYYDTKKMWHACHATMQNASIKSLWKKGKL
tara:strand:+ start:123 stop:503 length:381 start_codon:yes stop_codon:yes gene_type:complete